MKSYYNIKYDFIRFINMTEKANKSWTKKLFLTTKGGIT